MINAPGFVRPLESGEETAVDRLLQRAFGGTGEVQLVRKLRKARSIAGEMVLPLEGGIAGYYALSAMVAPKGWLCLAPVAVDPEMQGRGFGKRMVGLLTEWARLTGTPVVVLGETGFYEKAGFSGRDAEALSGPYPIENTLVAGLAKPAGPQGLIYPAAFESAA